MCAGATRRVFGWSAFLLVLAGTAGPAISFEPSFEPHFLSGRLRLKEHRDAPGSYRMDLRFDVAMFEAGVLACDPAAVALDCYYGNAGYGWWFGAPAGAWKGKKGKYSARMGDMQVKFRTATGVFSVRVQSWNTGIQESPLTFSAEVGIQASTCTAPWSPDPKRPPGLVFP